MADITTDINKIKEAVYGEEVRGSIVAALLAMNEQAEEAEEWATGNESGGTPSATNNAKYYAERARQVVNDKVDKIAGKGLSTNDYTNEDKQALAKAVQDISTLNTTKANAESVREKFDEITANFADGFDPAKTYKTGDAVMHDEKLYIRRQSASASGAWDTADWARVTVGEYLKLITMLYAGSSNWNMIDKIVKSGLAKAILPIGSQIEDSWSEAEGGTVYTVPWDIVHHYDNGDMAIKWHYATPTAVPFDEPEALFYAPASGLAAGQYYIVIGSAYDDGWVVGDKINFTLNSAMDEGDQFVITMSANSGNNPTASRTWRVYAKGDTVVKDTGTTSNSSVGTNLGTIAPESASKTNGIFNGMPRIVYGYGRWSQCAWRQWANSVANAGEWWEPQNPWDRPPTVAATLRGLLAGFSEEFLSLLQPVAVTTALNTVEGLEEAFETTYDKVFLPSMTQMYAAEQYTEDEPWEYYQTLAAQAGLTGRFKTGSSNIYEILKAYAVSNPTSPVSVRMRSATSSNAANTWYFYSTGYFTGSYAYAAYRGFPACIIKKSST